MLPHTENLRPRKSKAKIVITLAAISRRPLSSMVMWFIIFISYYYLVYLVKSKIVITLAAISSRPLRSMMMIVIVGVIKEQGEDGDHIDNHDDHGQNQKIIFTSSKIYMRMLRYFFLIM